MYQGKEYYPLSVDELTDHNIKVMRVQKKQVDEDKVNADTMV